MNHLSLINIDKHQDNTERLSTIYESPSPQPEIDEEIDNSTSDKLIIYDIASTNHPIPESITSPSSIINRNRFNSCYTDASFEPCPNFTNNLTASRLCGTTTMITSKVNHPSSLSTLLTINNNENRSSSPVINTQLIPLSLSPKPQSSSLSSPMLFLNDNNQLSSSEQSFQHVKKMKVIQSSSSSLSDFISSTPIQNSNKSYEEPSNIAHHSLTNCSSIDENKILNNNNNNERRSSFSRRILTNGLLFSHYATNPIPCRIQEPLHSIKSKTEEKFSSDSSSSSELLSSSDEKLLTRSEFILQQEQNISQQRKASSLKSISMLSPQTLSKILYPIDFETNHIDKSWHQKRSSHSYKVPTSDSGIVIDTQPTSKSSIEEV
jgi:hypothetical protein